jgi:hypothetical protein
MSSYPWYLPPEFRHEVEEPSDNWDDVILAEELGLDEPRCPVCGVPSTGVCVDCAAPAEHDRRFDDFYSTQAGDVGDQEFDLDSPPY